MSENLRVERAIVLVWLAVFASIAAAAESVDTPPAKQCCVPMTMTITHADGRSAGNRATSTISIPNHSFPANTTIMLNDTITWTNNDVDPHTATSDNGDAFTFDTGQIGPNQSGSVTFTLAGTFPYHCNNHAEMNGTIVVQAPAPAVITSSLTATATVGVNFSYTITATGTAPITFSAPSGLPTGITLNGAVLSGQFSTPGDVSIDLKAANSAGSDTKTLVVTVSNPTPPTITSPLAVDAHVGAAFTYTITADGTQPITFSSPDLPQGFTLNGATISGTFSATGNVNITLKADNVANQPDTKVLMVNVLPAIVPPAITSSLSANAFTGVAFTYAITASGDAPITFSATGLPAGLQLAGATISGTASAIGTFSVTLKATNGGGSDTKTLVLVVSSDITGAWTGSLSGKDFSENAGDKTSAPAKGTLTVTFTPNGADLSAQATFTVNGQPETYTINGKYGANNFWLTGASGAVEHIIISGHVDKKGKSIKGVSIDYGVDGAVESKFSLKRQ